VHVEVLTTLPEREQLVSLDEKPEPATKTIDPVRAEDGVSVIERVIALLLVEVVVVTMLTVNVPDAESPVDPTAVIV
jgi:hypothetical protein